MTQFSTAVVFLWISQILSLVRCWAFLCEKRTQHLNSPLLRRFVYYRTGTVIFVLVLIHAAQISSLFCVWLFTNAPSSSLKLTSAVPGLCFLFVQCLALKIRAMCSCGTAFLWCPLSDSKLLLDFQTFFVAVLWPIFYWCEAMQVQEMISVWLAGDTFFRL